MDPTSKWGLAKKWGLAPTFREERGACTHLH